MSKKKILLVEDDMHLGQILAEYLRVKGYEVVWCHDGKVGYNTYKIGNFDFCMLDVMLPKKDGFTLAKEIRITDEHIPILFLTAKSMRDDIIEGLKIGADDYLTKPFSMEELLLRTHALLKRTENIRHLKSTRQPIQLGKIIYHYEQSMLERPSGTTKLTSRENELLKILCDYTNQLLDRNVALMKVWRNNTYFHARSMDVYISKLRKILKEEQAVRILTIHGQGFKLVKTD